MRGWESVESKPAAHNHPPPAEQLTAGSWRWSTQQLLLHSELTQVIDYQIHKLELINNLTTEQWEHGIIHFQLSAYRHRPLA